MFFASVATVVFGCTGLVLSFFSQDLAIRFAVRPWGKAVLAGCFIRLRVKGVENIPSEPSVIMYNHQSAFDIPALTASLPVEYRMVMKNEVLMIPFIGWLSKAGGHYFVSRDGGGGDSKQLKIMSRAISQKKQTLALAPEGTRSATGRLLDFKKGGFLLASVTGAPVVPVIIWGGKDIKKKSGWVFKPGGGMSVEFLPPFYPDKSLAGRKRIEKLERGVRGAMLAKVEERFQDEEASAVQ
ncbi:lysophospholipid acyltransferase family protein [Candidatus Mycalebacterium sp.]